MSGMNSLWRHLFLPVRRKLMAIAVCWICGILLAGGHVVPPLMTGILCALLLAWAAFRLARRKSALFCISVCMLLTANGLAGHALLIRDEPTEPGVIISGVVSAIEKPYRVYLRDAEVEGEQPFARDVLVTLMLKEGETRPQVFVGQHISGIGRLFAPEEPRNPGGVNRRTAALIDGYELSGYILPGWSAEGEGRFSLRDSFRRASDALLEHIERLFGERAPLFQGIMLGDRSGMDANLVASMRLTGTVHVITVSGLHLLMIASVLRRLVRVLPVGRLAGFCIQTIVLSAFAGLTGCAAGTVRALIMAVIRELALLRGRRYEPLTALSAAALLMTAYRPLWALNASFQFSFFVVLGIQLLSAGLRAAAKRAALPRILSGILSTVSMSAGAQIAAIPMQLLFYGYMPLLSLPMNLLCSMLIPVLLLGGWAAALIGLIGGFAPAQALARMLGALAGLFESANLSAASLRGSILRLPAPYGISILFFACLMMLLSSRIKWGGAREKAAVLIVLLLLASYLPRLDPTPRYVQIDVGQGDAALLRRGRKAVLVDVGPKDSYDMLRYLRCEGLEVEAAILSHLDEDHAGALGVLKESEISIPALVMPERAIGEEATEAVLEAIGGMAFDGTQIHEVARGAGISVLGMNMDVLAPDDFSTGSNERSLLLHAQMEGVSFLLAGDLPTEYEPDAVPDCDVLKVAHHGSRYATSDRFLDMAKPELALISVGAGNRYGHPTERVLDSLASAGCAVLRTDEAGCITLRLRRGGIQEVTYFMQ